MHAQSTQQIYKQYPTLPKERRTYICVLLKSQERGKRTKGLHLCAFEDLGEVKRTKGLHLCALGDSGGAIRTKKLHLRAFEDLGEGQKNEGPTFVCF